MNCYVVAQSTAYEMPEGANKDNTLFFPETAMTYREQRATTRPRDFHIITDCPSLVPLYRSEEVFVWQDGEWKCQAAEDYQTYGTSINLIVSRIWGIKETIPYACLSREMVTNCMGHPLDYGEETDAAEARIS